MLETCSRRKSAAVMLRTCSRRKSAEVMLSTCSRRKSAAVMRSVFSKIFEPCVHRAGTMTLLLRYIADSLSAIAPHVKRCLPDETGYVEGYQHIDLCLDSHGYAVHALFMTSSKATLVHVSGEASLQNRLKFVAYLVGAGRTPRCRTKSYASVAVRVCVGGSGCARAFDCELHAWSIAPLADCLI